MLKFALATVNSLAYMKRCHTGQTASEFAYGEWIFFIGRNENSDDVKVLFIADTIGDEAAAGQDGYNLTISTNFEVELNKSTAGVETNLFKTAVDTAVPYDVNGFKIIRDGSGIFTVYMYDMDIGTWSLLTASTGTNPVTDNTHTTSEYIVFDARQYGFLVWSNKNGFQNFSKVTL